MKKPTTNHRLTTRGALLTWALTLGRPVTESEIRAKAKELRGSHFSEAEFSDQLSPVWHIDSCQCDECSGTLCRPLLRKTDPLWATFFEWANPIFYDTPADYELTYKVTQW